MPIFELRQYRVRPGQRDRWVSFFEKEIVPFQTEQGMTIIGSWVGEEDADLFVWMRRFESEAERERLYKLVYESDHWKNNIGPQAADFLVRGEAKITRMLPTSNSALA